MPLLLLLLFFTLLAPVVPLGADSGGVGSIASSGDNVAVGRDGVGVGIDAPNFFVVNEASRERNNNAAREKAPRGRPKREAGREAGRQ